MTSRETTGYLPQGEAGLHRSWREKALVAGWAVVQWPWLLRSLSGGRRRDKAALLDRLDLPHDALPNLGSWKADTFFLTRIADAIAADRPACVVELGAGASSLIAARALQLHGGGTLTSFDQNAAFVAATARWLTENGLNADIRHAPLASQDGKWASCWYDLDHVPDTIDLLIIDGPPWTLNPFVRGAAERLFDRLSKGGRVLLDDAARPGERVVARRWRKRWPDIEFVLHRGGTKGMLEGRRKV
ncbi:class I SAM-dependent methyltransferase [uncultured Croceicoccus sp.]|uniref:class I SAM-dependent methyltransferase n=1 Tax=uncultured Croceicoccus sp. TaxID=1295329 RepID=UPI00261E5539|nr:class I SAM-dependent methyltransferase [uncultured Croceicoccus sp.]